MKNSFLLILSFFSILILGQNKPTDFKKTFETELKNWTIKFEKLNLDEFQNLETIDITKIEKTDKSFDNLSKDDKKFGYFSPNQHSFIDAFSFLNIDFENGKYKSSPDIDQSIDFYDNKNNTSKTLVFCGSTEGIDEIVYVTEKLVLLVGSKFENEKKMPIIYVLDLNNNVLQKFENSKSKQMKHYKSEKLKDVKI